MRLGNTNAEGKDTEDGKLYWGNKDQKYLEDKSRQAVEEHHNVSILYFETDWHNSEKNFYKEIKKIKFVNQQGAAVRCSFTLNQTDILNKGVSLKKTMKLIVSLYDEELESQNIKIKRGDYFSIGKRMYYIYDYTTKDTSGPGVLMNREKIRTDYYAYEESDEKIGTDIFGKNSGSEAEIRNKF